MYMYHVRHVCHAREVIMVHVVHSITVRYVKGREVIVIVFLFSFVCNVFTGLSALLPAFVLTLSFVFTTNS